jgi:DMSO reductase family type II enzyme heme b subunit
MQQTAKTPWRRTGAARRQRWTVVLWSVGLGLAMATAAVAQAPRGAAPPQDVEAGKQIYTRKCAQCHGDDGQGMGPAADVVFPKPRDFTRGVYKIRTTPSGTVPTDDDLFRVITNGLPGTSMPGWSVLPERDRRQLVQYIKTFSEKFNEPAPTPITIPPEVPSSAESIARGQELYRDAECWQCHGDAGRGDGPSLPDLRDDWDQPIWPANLTKCWNFRGGSTRQDIFRAFMTGLSGTPMPSYADIFEPAQAWDLTNYVHSLCRNRTVDIVVRSIATTDELPTEVNDPRWAKVPAIDFPLVGQIIQEPRQFTPSIDAVTVRAMHNVREIVFLLSWDDRTHSKANPEAQLHDDAFVVQWPVRLTDGPEIPYFLYGDTSRPVYLWRWTASTEGISELNATGFGSESPQRQESQNLQGTVVYDHGQYQMLVRRTLTTADQEIDVQLEEARFIPIAFSAWDGSNGEAGNKRAISAWYYLYLEPTPSRARFLYPAIAVVAIAGIELFFSRPRRRRAAES